MALNSSSAFESFAAYTTVSLHPPYNEYFAKGHISIIKKTKDARGRRFIVFKESTGVEIPKDVAIPKTGTTYARYLYNVHLWKTEGRLLSTDLEIDHINGNSLDDRLENLEAVTQEENIRRRDIQTYQSLPLDDALLKELDSLLTAGENRRVIVAELGIPPGYVRYLIQMYLPNHRHCIAESVARDINDIMKRRTEGETCDQIAEFYGVNTITIKRMLYKHAPQLTGAARRKERRDYIIKRVHEGAHYNDIAKELGCTPLNVWYYIKKHLPEIAKRDYYDKENQNHTEIADRNALIIKTIAPFINRGVRYCEFDDAKWGLPNGNSLHSIVVRYDKDGLVKPLHRNRPKSEQPTIEEVMEKHPELKGTLPIKL